MKKLFVVLALVLVLVSMFAACGKTTECEICGQTKKCTEVEFMGEKGWVCDDCKKGLDALNSLGELFG